MKINIFFLMAVLVTFSSQSFATNVDEWNYENITGTLKPTAGCKDKDKATKQASSGYRFKKYAKLLCGSKGYGWAIDEIVDNGEVICEECEGDYENTEKYRCHVKDVVVKCKQVAR